MGLINSGRRQLIDHINSRGWISAQLEATQSPTHRSERKPSLGPLHQWFEPPNYDRNDYHVLAFGYYNTLVDEKKVESDIGHRFGLRPQAAAQVYLKWVQYQFELMNLWQYLDFTDIQRRALYRTAIKFGLKADQAGLDYFATYSYMGGSFIEGMEGKVVQWGGLRILQDVYAAFRELSRMPKARIRIFTNGEEGCVRVNFEDNHDLRPLEPTMRLKEKIISPKAISEWASVGKFKPALEMYQALLSREGMVGKKQQVWLISVNPVDIRAAQAVGLSTIWVNRTQNPVHEPL